MKLYLGSNISSTENDVKIRKDQAWTTIDRLTTMWKSDFSNKMKQIFPSSRCVSTAV